MKRRILACALTVLIAAAAVAGSVPLVNLALKKAETATVSAPETENGTVTLGGKNGSVTVRPGDTVTVKTEPDDGYYADSLAVFSGDGSRTVYLSGNTAEIAVEADTTVVPVFQKNGTVGSAAVRPAGITPGKAEKSAESYLLSHADAKYAGKSDKAKFADMLNVTATVVDGEKLPDATLDKLNADPDGDGLSDNYSALLSQGVYYIALYELDPAAEYYAGWAGITADNAVLTDWGAAKNNTRAEMLDGFAVDGDTGIVYVPKKYTDLSDKDNPVILYSRVQLVYTVKDASQYVNIDFTANTEKLKTGVPEQGTVSVPVISTATKVRLAESKKDRRKITKRTIDGVTVNGITYGKDDGMWTYDTSEGTLELAMPPAAVHCLTVNMSGGFVKTVKNLWDRFISVFGFKADAISKPTDLNIIGTWKFSQTPKAGENAILGLESYSYTNPAKGGYTLPGIPKSDILKKAFGAAGINPNELSKYGSITKNDYVDHNVKIRVQTASTDKNSKLIIEQAVQLALKCCHVGLSTNFEFTSANYTPKAVKNCRIHVVQVNGEYCIIGVTSPTVYTQAGAGFFTIRWELSEKRGQISIHKKSEDGRNLQGAEFLAVKQDEPKKGETYRIGPTDANGNAATPDRSVLYGTYSITETKYPANYGAGSITPSTVTVNDAGGGKATVEAVNNLKKGQIRVHKASNNNDNPLAGAKFEAVKTDEPYKGTKYTIGPTDANGNASVSNVWYGTYSVVETVFPANHSAGQTTRWTVTVNDANSGVIDIQASNSYHPNLKIEKTGANPEDYTGKIFDVYDSNDNIVLTLTTDEHGKAGGRLPCYGDYTIKERDSENYAVSFDGNSGNTYEFSYKSGDDKTIKVNNELLPGVFELRKTSDDGILGGFKFKVTGENGKEYTGVTDNSGILTTKDPVRFVYGFTESDQGKRYAVIDPGTTLGTLLSYMPDGGKGYYLEISQEYVYSEYRDTMGGDEHYWYYDHRHQDTEIDPTNDSNVFDLPNSDLTLSQILWTENEWDQIPYTVSYNIKDGTDALYAEVLCLGSSGDFHYGDGYGTITYEQLLADDMPDLDVGAITKWLNGKTFETEDEFIEYAKENYLDLDTYFNGAAYFASNDDYNSWYLQDELYHTSTDPHLKLTDVMYFFLNLGSTKDNGSCYFPMAELEWIEFPGEFGEGYGGSSPGDGHSHVPDIVPKIEIEESSRGFYTYDINGDEVIDWHDFYEMYYSSTHGGSYEPYPMVLPAGTYTVEEIDPPERYVKPEKKTVVVKPEETTLSYFRNRIKEPDKAYARIVKKSEDGVVANVKFTIAGDNVNETVTTDQTGEICKELKPGTYTVTEIEVAGRYVPPAAQTVAVKEGEIATVTFENKLKEFPLKIVKQSDDGVVEGIKFQISGVSNTGEVVSRTVTTGADGTIAENLKPGKYTVHEIQDSGGKYIPQEDQTVTLTDGEASVTFVNRLKKIKLRVSKRDAESGETPAGGASLKGAVYGLYRNGELVNRYTTDEHGEFTTDEFVCGDGYTVKEISPSPGYLLDNTEYPVDANCENYYAEVSVAEMTVYESPVTGSIAVLKKMGRGDSWAKESGAKFRVYLKSAGSYEQAAERERDEFTTQGYDDTDDENEIGVGRSKQLPYGVYIVHQVSAPEGVVLAKLADDFEVTIGNEHEKEYLYEVKNELVPAEVQLTKTSAGEDRLLLPGATFEIRDLMTDALIETLRSGDDGKTNTVSLYPGYYTIVETYAPNGYSVLPEPVPLTVELNGEVNIGEWGALSTDLTVSDETARYTLLKTDPAGAPLKDCEFTLYNSDGEAVQTATSDENGIVTFDNLKTGTYTVRETAAPKEWQVSGKTVTFTVDGTWVNSEEPNFTFVNEHGKKLPALGSPLLPVIAACGAGLTFAAIRLGGKKRKKTNH